MSTNAGVRKVIAATALAIGSMACSTPPPRTVLAESEVAKTSTVEQAHMLERLYWLADANHDWRLTREEARERLAITYHEFDEIDVRKRGWITLKQYLAFHEARAKGPGDRPPPDSLR